MADWDPQLYNRFRRYRAEPVDHILGRLQIGDSERILDLGCGPGDNSIELARRTNHGAARGIDSSPAMIDAAAKSLALLDADLRARVSFELADVAAVPPSAAWTIVFSNATLQWLRGHRAIFTRLYAALAPGGALVVQMPANAFETAKLQMDVLAQDDPWREIIGAVDLPFRRDAVPEHYAAMLTEIGFADVDCYYRTFHHPMNNPAEVVQWYRSTGLRPYLDALPENRRDEFLDAYTRRLERAYGTSGPITFDFRRIFIWARRPPA